MSTATADKTFDCPECGFRARCDAMSVAEGRAPRKRKTCPTCLGAGTVVVDSSAIKKAIVATRGANKGKLRESRPKMMKDGGVYGAAYVWRFIRFDCGKDLHLPMMAPDLAGFIGLRHDSDEALREELDAIVTTVGNELFGKAGMATGALAWGSVLGFN